MKKYIIGFIMGAIICGSITTVALTIASKDVSYDNTNSDSENTNVQGVIDELYERINSIQTFPETVTFNLRASTSQTYSGGQSIAYLTIPFPKSLTGYNKLTLTYSGTTYNYKTRIYVNGAWTSWGTYNLNDYEYQQIQVMVYGGLDTTGGTLNVTLSRV